MKIFIVALFFTISQLSNASLVLRQSDEICKVVNTLENIYLYNSRSNVLDAVFEKQPQGNFLMTLPVISQSIHVKFVVHEGQCKSLLDLKYGTIQAGIVIKSLRYSDAYPYHVDKMVVGATDDSSNAKDTIYYVKY